MTSRRKTRATPARPRERDERQRRGPEAVVEHGQLYERAACRREHARELAQVAEHDPPPGQVLEHEVADERVRDRVRDAVEPVAGDEPELDVRRP